MSVWQCCLVLVAGLCAGTLNTVVGSGTLVTFPVLIGVGLSPVLANVSNSVGLSPGSIVGAWGYRSELVGQRRQTLRLAAASTVGAVVGAALLVLLPASSFTAVVPVLIIVAVVLVLVGPRIADRSGCIQNAETERTRPVLWGLTLVAAVYGGYFGAAQGVVLMGLFGILLAGRIQQQNAIKNVLTALVNVVATVVFIATTEIDWAMAGLVALGAIFGGLIGASIGRRLSPSILRSVIVVVGVAAAVKFTV